MFDPQVTVSEIRDYYSPEMISWRRTMSFEQYMQDFERYLNRAFGMSSDFPLQKRGCEPKKP